MTLPRTRVVRIFGVRYRLRFVHGDKDAMLANKALGVCEWNRDGTPTITVDKTKPDDEVRGIMWHEIVHAIGGELGINELIHNEKIVNPFARALFGVLKDNPALARWLIGLDE